MIPLRDDVPCRSNPIVTWGLIAANVVAFAWELHLGGSAERLVRGYGLVPAELHGHRALPERWLPLLTSLFLHGSVPHLVGNMLYLHIFGDNVEDRLGHLRFLGFYLLCGVVAGLAQAAATPASRIPVVGASGAVAGVIGAYFVTFPRARVVTAVPLLFVWTVVRVPAVVFLLAWFVLQFAYGLGSSGAGSSGAAGGVAWWAHVAGFVAGATLGQVPARARARR